MQTFHFIPDELQSDAELCAWLEEQAARVAHENSEAFSDEESHDWACF